jgi:hypothetical protein
LNPYSIVSLVLTSVGLLLSIIGLGGFIGYILGFIGYILGIIGLYLGVVARRQLKVTGQKGSVLALIAVVFGYIVLFLFLLDVVLGLVTLISMRNMY